MIRPCSITPNSCPGEDSPITNLSSEQPDPLLFAGHGWDPYNPYRPPPLGDGQVNPTDCSNITWSAVSQEMADLLAQLNAANCTPPNPPGPPGPWIWPPFPPMPPWLPNNMVWPLPDDFCKMTTAPVWWPSDVSWPPPPGMCSPLPPWPQMPPWVPPNIFWPDICSLTTAPDWWPSNVPWPPPPGMCGPLPLPPDVSRQFPDFTFSPPTGDPQSPWTPPQPNYQQFINESQSATASCPNGAVFTFTIPAGTLISGPVPPELGPAMTQLLNAQALAIAQQQVWAMRVCIDVPGMVLRTPPTVPPTPPPSPGTTNSSLASYPGWCCFGEELDPELNSYVIPSSSGEFSFSLGGNPAPGTTLVKSGPRSAVMVGTPVAPGEYSYTITATQTNGPGISVTITDKLKVFGMIESTLPDATVGTDYSAQLTTAGGTAPITFSLVGSLPDGLTMDGSGLISGTPTTAGTSAFTVKFTDADGGTCQKSLAITVADSTTPCSLQPPSDGTVGTHYLWGLWDGWIGFLTPPITFSLYSGNLPPGISLASDGTLEGDPTTDGVFVFAVRVQDAAGTDCIAPLSVTIVTLSFCGASNQNIGSLIWSDGGYNGPPGNWTFAMAGGDGFIHGAGTENGIGVLMTASDLCVADPAGYDCTFHADITGSNTSPSYCTVGFRVDGAPVAADYSSAAASYSASKDISFHLDQGHHVLSLGVGIVNNTLLGPTTLNLDNIQIRPLAPP